jgi:type IV pilus assembly protein PilM
MAHTVVGLDIGASGVRAAEFRLAARRKPHLRKFATCPLPEGAVSRGVVVDGAAVTQALRSLWSRGRFSTKTVVLGIANEGVLVRQMDLDWMPPADFRKALRYQVAEALPVPVDEANLDYHLLEEIEVAGEGAGQTKRMNRILLVAAARDVVDGYVTAAQSAGLRVTRADLLPFALIRVASPRSSLNAPAEAIIDIGADTTSLVVHQGGRPCFVRMIPATGSNTITKTLQDTYDWTWEEAERSKIALGTGALSGADPSLPAVAPHPAQQVIADQARKLVTEVGATLDFFLGSSGGSTELSRVLLCGAGARLGGLSELFAEELGLPVETLQPLRGIRASGRLAMDDDRCAQLSVSAGLCMGVPA